LNLRGGGRCEFLEEDEGGSENSLGKGGWEFPKEEGEGEGDLKIQRKRGMGREGEADLYNRFHEAKRIPTHSVETPGQPRLCVNASILIQGMPYKFSQGQSHWTSPIRSALTWGLRGETPFLSGVCENEGPRSSTSGYAFLLCSGPSLSHTPSSVGLSPYIHSCT
jgi:hypothetical protein